MTETTIKTTEKLIEAVEKADSADALLAAVEALAEVRSPQAIPTLIEVLGYNNPGAAVAAVEGLIEIGEAAVPHLLKNLDDYNYGARAWAIRAFAGIGDPRCLDLLLTAASSDFSLSVRRAAAKGLGIIKWEKLPAPEVEPAQVKVWETLLLTSSDGEWVVRYATVVSLEALYLAMSSRADRGWAKTKSDLEPKIEARLAEMLNADGEIAVRARAKLALTKLTKTEHS
jgi:phycocyanobilin lyase beta subunit